MEAEEDHGCDFQTNLCGTRARIRACHHPLCPSPPRRRSNAIEGRSLAAHVPPTRRLAHEDGGTRVRLSCRLYPPRISRPGSIEVHRRYSSLLTRRWRGQSRANPSLQQIPCYLGISREFRSFSPPRPVKRSK